MKRYKTTDSVKRITQDRVKITNIKKLVSTSKIMVIMVNTKNNKGNKTQRNIVQNMPDLRVSLNRT